MNRTTLGYFLMTACSAALLWGILRAGRRLDAPPDWAGRWQIAEPALPPRAAEVQQSGVYFHIRLGDEPVRAYKLQGHDPDYILAGQTGSRHARFETADGWLSLKLTDPSGQQPPVRLVRETAAPAHGSR